jgi:hypothetical protein
MKDVEQWDLGEEAARMAALGLDDIVFFLGCSLKRTKKRCWAAKGGGKDFGLGRLKVSSRRY